MPDIKNQISAPVTSTKWAPEPSAVDVEPQPVSDSADLETETGGIPPARTGQSSSEELPVEGAGKDNPTHHTGRLPNSPLTE